MLPPASQPAAAQDDVVDDYGNPIGAAAATPAAPAPVAVAASDDIVDDNGEPVQQDGSGFFGGALRRAADFGIGALKGAGSTVYGLGKIASNIPGIPQVSEALGADPSLARFEGDKPEELEPQGGWQRGGFITEQIAENFLPGSLVDKSVRATKGMSAGARMLDMGWREGLSGAGTAFAQTGGDAESAVYSGAAGALTRGLMSWRAFIRDEQAAKEAVEIAQKWGIPLLKAEQTGDALKKFIENFYLPRQPGSAKIMGEFKLHRVEKIENLARKVVEDLDPKVMEPQEMGRYVQTQLGRVNSAAQDALHQATDPILEKASSAKLDLGKLDEATGEYVPSELSAAARELLESGSFDEIAKFVGSHSASIDDVSKARDLLEAFAKPFEVRPPDPIEAALNPNAEGQKVLKSLSLGAAKQLRTMLFDATAFSESTIGKGAIKRLNSALHDEMMETLSRNGMDAEAEAFEKASSAYRSTMQKLEANVIEALWRKSAKEGAQIPPEQIAERIVGTNAESTMQALGKMLPEQDLQRIRASLLNETIEKSMAPEGFFDAHRFKSAMDKLSRGKGRELYGEELYGKLRELSKLAEKFRITPVEAGYATGEKMPLLAQIKLNSIAPLKMLGGGGLVFGGVDAAAKGAAAAVAMSALEVIVTNRWAAKLTDPKVVDDLTTALRDPMSTLGKQAAARLSASVTKWAAEEQQRANREIALEVQPGGPQLSPEDSAAIDRMEKLGAELRALRGNPSANPDEILRLEAEYDAASRGQ